jgi:hypothetical protein
MTAVAKGMVDVVVEIAVLLAAQGGRAATLSADADVLALGDHYPISLQGGGCCHPITRSSGASRLRSGQAKTWLRCWGCLFASGYWHGCYSYPSPGGRVSMKIKDLLDPIFDPEGVRVVVFDLKELRWCKYLIDIYL